MLSYKNNGKIYYLRTKTMLKLPLTLEFVKNHDNEDYQHLLDAAESTSKVDWLELGGDHLKCLVDNMTGIPVPKHIDEKTLVYYSGNMAAFIIHNIYNWLR